MAGKPHISSLDEKVKIIEARKKDTNVINDNSLVFKCENTQIYDTLAMKRWIESNVNLKRTAKVTYSKRINELVWNFFMRFFNRYLI